MEPNITKFSKSKYYDPVLDVLKEGASDSEKSAYEDVHNGEDWEEFYKEEHPEMKHPYKLWNGNIIERNRTDGGPGSGNFGHEGRPNKIGGSAPSNANRPVVQGKDISKTWKRRKNEFKFAIQDVMNAQGFNGLPKVVDEDEFNDAVKESGIIAQRVYSADSQETLDAYRDQLYNGEWYIDCSNGGAQYGRGMYSVIGKDGKITDDVIAEVQSYIDTSDKKIPKDEWLKRAEVGIRGNTDYDDQKMRLALEWADAYYDRDHNKSKDLMKKLSDDDREELNEIFQDYVQENEYKPHYIETFTLTPDARILDQRKLIDLKYGNDGKAYLDFCKEADERDDGSFTASMGYDAIKTTSGYLLVLNRTKVIFKKDESRTDSEDNRIYFQYDDDGNLWAIKNRKVIGVVKSGGFRNTNTDEKEPDNWITVKGNHIPLDENNEPMGGQLKALGIYRTKPHKIQDNEIETLRDGSKVTIHYPKGPAQTFVKTGAVYVNKENGISLNYSEMNDCPWDITVEEATNKYSNKNRKVVNGKNISENYKRRPEEFQFEIQDVLNAQGFDGLPKIVDENEFNEAVKKSGFIAKRVYSAENQEILDAYRDQLYNGDWYVDCSAGGASYGKGMYCCADYNGELSETTESEIDHYRKQYQGLGKDLSKEEWLKNAENALNKAWFGSWEGEKKELILKWVDAFYDKDHEKSKQLIDKIPESTRDTVNDILHGVSKKATPPSFTETFTLEPDAKIISYKDARNISSGIGEEGEAFRKELRSNIFHEAVKGKNLSDKEMLICKYRLDISENAEEDEKGYSAWKEIKGSPEYDKIKEVLEETRNKYDTKIDSMQKMDIGSFAAMLGYDAINSENHGKSGSYAVILNRTKCIFKKDEKRTDSEDDRITFQYDENGNLWAIKNRKVIGMVSSGDKPRMNTDEEPDSWITVNGNHIPIDKDGNPIGGQQKALGKKPYNGISDVGLKLMEKHKENPAYFGESKDQRDKDIQTMLSELKKAGVKGITHNTDKEDDWEYKVLSTDLSSEENRELSGFLNRTMFSAGYDEGEYIEACRKEGKEPRLSESKDTYDDGWFLTNSGRLQKDDNPVYIRLNKEKILNDKDLVDYSGASRIINPEGRNKYDEVNKEVIESLTQDQYNALNNYTKNFSDANYSAINRYLVTGEGSEKVKKNAEEIDKALDHEIGVDCITCRGTNDIIGFDNPNIPKYLKQISSGNYSNAGKLKSAINGKTVTNKAVMSTSPNDPTSNYGWLPVQYIFKTPANAKAVDISGLSAYGGGRSSIEKALANTGLFGSVENETEVAFKPNTKYRIDDVLFSMSIDQRKKKGQVYIVATILPDEKREDAEDEENWITINGTHVHLNEEGDIDKGPDALKNLSGEKESESKFKREFNDALKRESNYSVMNAVAKSLNETPVGYTVISHGNAYKKIGKDEYELELPSGKKEVSTTEDILSMHDKLDKEGDFDVKDDKYVHKAEGVNAVIDDRLKPSNDDYDFDDVHSINDFIRKNVDKLKPIYEEGGEDAIDAEFFKGRLANCTKDLHQMSVEKADDVLFENVSELTAQLWFREYKHDVKDKLVMQMTANPEAHNAALNIMYKNYRNECDAKNEKPLSFNEFLVTPIKMYRGGSGKEYEKAGVFSAYTFDRYVAEGFTSGPIGQSHKVDPNGIVYEAEIRPIDTYGSVFVNGEGEILVPREIAPNGNRDEADIGINQVENEYLRKNNLTKYAIYAKIKSGKTNIYDGKG